jgi:hypothetical protein
VWNAPSDERNRRQRYKKRQRKKAQNYKAGADEHEKFVTYFQIVECHAAQPELEHTPAQKILSKCKVRQENGQVAASTNFGDNVVNQEPLYLGTTFGVNSWS